MQPFLGKKVIPINRATVLTIKAILFLASKRTAMCRCATLTALTQAVRNSRLSILDTRRLIREVVEGWPVARGAFYLVVGADPRVRPVVSGTRLMAHGN